MERNNPRENTPTVNGEKDSLDVLLDSPSLQLSIRYLLFLFPPCHPHPSPPFPRPLHLERKTLSSPSLPHYLDYTPIFFLTRFRRKGQLSSPDLLHSGGFSHLNLLFIYLFQDLLSVCWSDCYPFFPLRICCRTPLGWSHSYPATSVFFACQNRVDVGKADSPVSDYSSLHL
jgi:hypothetical protein